MASFSSTAVEGGSGASRPSVLQRADSFIAVSDRLTRDEVRAWMPEIRELYTVLLEAQSRRNPRGTHARPDPALARRLNGLLILIGKAELIGVVDEHGELVEHGLEECGKPRPRRTS